MDVEDPFHPPPFPRLINVKKAQAARVNAYDFVVSIMRLLRIINDKPKEIFTV